MYVQKQSSGPLKSGKSIGGHSYCPSRLCPAARRMSHIDPGLLLSDLLSLLRVLGTHKAITREFHCCRHFAFARACHKSVPRSSPSHGGDVVVYVSDINQPSLPNPFYSVLVSVSVFIALSTVFHSINSPDNSPLSHSVLPVLFLPYWSFQLHISL